MTYDYAHLICFSPTHSSHMIGETVLQGLGTGHVSETDLTYEKPEENLTIHSGITVIVVPVYGGRIAETALERMEGSPKARAFCKSGLSGRYRYSNAQNQTELYQSGDVPPGF